MPGSRRPRPPRQPRPAPLARAAHSTPRPVPNAVRRRTPAAPSVRRALAKCARALLPGQLGKPHRGLFARPTPILLQPRHEPRADEIVPHEFTDFVAHPFRFLQPALAVVAAPAVGVAGSGCARPALAVEFCAVGDRSSRGARFSRGAGEVRESSGACLGETRTAGGGGASGSTGWQRRRAGGRPAGG